LVAVANSFWEGLRLLLPVLRFPAFALTVVANSTAANPGNIKMNAGMALTKLAMVQKKRFIGLAF
jgi:hypothetical protein